MNFSIIIPWMYENPQRIPLLEQTLECIHRQKRCDNNQYEVIVVEQSEHTFSTFTDDSVRPTQHIKHIKLKSSGIEFNKSWCINVAVRRSGSEYFLVWDADTIADPDFMLKVEEKAKANPVFVCWDHLIARPGKSNPVERHIYNKNLKTMGGIWCCQKNLFWGSFGGMNENFFGYGGEDNDLYMRVCHEMHYGAVPTMECTLVHLYHDWVPVGMIPRYARILKCTREHLSLITQRLKEIRTGNPDHPTLIQLIDM